MFGYSFLEGDNHDKYCISYITTELFPLKIFSNSQIPDTRKKYIFKLPVIVFMQEYDIWVERTLYHRKSISYVQGSLNPNIIFLHKDYDWQLIEIWTFVRKIKSLILNSSLSFYARSGPLQLGVVLVFNILMTIIYHMCIV